MDTNQGSGTSVILNKDELTMQELVRDYLCPLCNEIMYHAVQTNCGHNFCRYCLLKWVHTGFGTCPLCESKYESHIPLETIDAYIDNAFAGVNMTLQEQRQVLIGSRYFPERQLCLQDFERQRRVEVNRQKQAQKEMEVKQLTCSGDVNRKISHSEMNEVLELDETPDFEKIKQGISEIFGTQRNKPPALRRNYRSRSRRRLVPKVSFEEYSKVKAEIREIIMKNERHKGLTKSSSDLKQLFRSEPLDHFPKPDIQEECRVRAIPDAPAKPQSESTDNLAELIRSADRMREYTEKLLRDSAVEYPISENEAKENRIENDLEDSRDKIQPKASQANETVCSPQESKEAPVTEEMLKSHESRIRIQFELFTTEMEKLIKVLKPPASDLIPVKVSTNDQSKKEMEETLAATKTKLQELILKHSALKLAESEAQLAEQRPNISSMKSSKRIDGKPIRKPSFRVRRPTKPSRRKFKVRPRCELQSLSTTSSLEALNSNSLADLTSVTQDVEAQESRLEHSKSKRHLKNDADSEAPQSRHLKQDTTTTDSSIVTKKPPRPQQKEGKKPQEPVPEWFTNCKKLQLKKLLSNSKLAGNLTLEPGSGTVSLLQTNNKLQSILKDNTKPKTLNLGSPQLLLPFGNLREEGIENSGLFGTKLEPRKFSLKPYDLNSVNRNPGNNLLFGSTSPYFEWKPGMMLTNTSGKPPIVPFSRTDKMSRAPPIPTRSTNSPAELHTKTVTQKDKDRLVAKVRKQMEEEAEMRQLILQRESMIEKLKKANKSKKKKLKPPLPPFRTCK